MQQEASRKLNMPPRRTMAIAQQLYEGVDISGEGTVDLITYMGTDSLRISDEAQAAALSFIESRYGAAYRPETPKQYKADVYKRQSTWRSTRCPVWWVRLPDTWVTRRAASSRKRCAVSPIPWCLSLIHI